MTVKEANIVLNVLKDVSIPRMTAVQKQLYRRATQTVRTIRKRPNPARAASPVKIYERVLRVEAQKGKTHRCDAECRAANHCYFHDFKAGAVAWGMPDGSVLLKSKTGRKLWGMF